MTPLETVNEFIRLINAMDIDGAVALCSDDVEYDNVPMGKNLGPAAVKEFLAPMVGGVDAVEFIVHRQAATGNVVMNERTDILVMGDNRIELPVMGVFEFEGDKISAWRDYFDMSAFTGG